MLPHTGLFLLGKVALQMRIRRPFISNAKNDAVIPANAGIQTPRHGNLSSKTVSQILRSRFPRSRE
ncbi:hypothetical protein F7O71_07550 [Neisseria meningitidis]|nr:hypothetical protein [Neisseria meningitidis]